MCPSLIEIGSKTAEKNSAQTNRQTDKQTDKHYKNNSHLAVNQNVANSLAYIWKVMWHAILTITTTLKPWFHVKITLKNFCVVRRQV